MLEVELPNLLLANLTSIFTTNQNKNSECLDSEYSLFDVERDGKPEPSAITILDS